MRIFLTVAFALFASAAFAEQPGCWLQDAKGDRFVFSTNPWIWTYKPVGGKSEACAFGQDPDTGAHTLDCPDHKIIGAIVFGEDNGARILNREWTRHCR